jgi:hypothetical protein
MAQDTTVNPQGGTADLGDAFGSVETKPTTRASRAASAASNEREHDEHDDDHDEHDDDSTDSRRTRDTGHDDEGDAGDDTGTGEGNDEDDEDEDGQPRARGDTFELKVNGEVRKLTREQVLEAASKGFSAHERWERASALHKQSEQVVQQINAQRAQLGTMLNNAAAQYRALIQTETPNLDELALTDPAQYIRQKHLLDRRTEALRNAEAAHAYLVQQQVQQNEARKGAFLEVQKDAVLNDIPEWRDSDKAKKGVARINAYLAERGFTNDEIAGIGDARYVRVLHEAVVNAEKAKKYDELRSKSRDANKRVEKLPPVVETPGTRQAPSTAKAEQRKRDVKRWEQKPDLNNLARLF